MPDHEDSLGGETFSGEEQQDPAQQSLGDGATMGGDTAAHSLGDQSTFGDTNVDDELFDDGMELVDLSTRYTEEGVLGKGGMGEVILATDTRLNRKVAIKRIIGKAARSKTAVQRFLTEAQSIAALSHNNIVQIHDYGRSIDGPFLIMECVQGGSLLEKCKAGPIELDKAVNIFGQLCDGLSKAHAGGIIHRDIKPANVLMTQDGTPKLTDFGLAKDDTADTGLSLPDAVMGTPDYMSPEQQKGVEFTDHRSDLWSLAATFYQMVTGKSPKVINIASLPPKLQSAVAKALEESKEDRFQSAMEMREAILQAHLGKIDRTRTLAEGECPQCTTPNPSDGKFCVECTTALQVDCLKCTVKIQIWNKGCGECGSLQAPLVEKALSALKAIHDQAESLLVDFEFEAAVDEASRMIRSEDSRLQQYASWHDDFSARLELSKTTELGRLEELVGEALAHEEAYDYKAALQTLELIAPSLKQIMVDEVDLNTSAEEVTERLTTKQSRLKELEGIVRERLTKDEHKGLLPLVDELLALKPDRPERRKLRAQLVKREQFIAFLKNGDYEGALSLDPNSGKALAMKKTADIETALDYGDYEIALSLNPNSSKALAMKKAVEIKAALASGDYENALSLDPSNFDALAMKKAVEIKAALASGDYKNALSLDPSNFDALAMKKAAEIKAALAGGDYEVALSLAPNNSEALNMKKAADIGIALDSGDFESVLIIDSCNETGLQMRTAAIDESLRNGEWEYVLALDPQNGEALQMREIEHFFDIGDFYSVLELDPCNVTGLEMKAIACLRAYPKLVRKVRTAKKNYKMRKFSKCAKILKEISLVTDLPTAEQDLLADANRELLAKVRERKYDKENKKDSRRSFRLDKIGAKDSRRSFRLDKIGAVGMEWWGLVILGLIALFYTQGETWIAQLTRPQVTRTYNQAEIRAKSRSDWENIAAENAAAAEKDAAAERAAILASDPITNTFGMTLKEIPAGTFMMGSQKRGEIMNSSDEYLHKVTITTPFYIQTTEVTQGHWQAVMGTEPWKGSHVKEGPNYAAVYVNWNDAVAYCKKLSAKEGKTYRLPTEAEWEYACRAGTETRWSFGYDEDELGDYAWYHNNAHDIDERYAHQVGLKTPNAFGLYDMHGNVWEWCHDYYGPYPLTQLSLDPQGPRSGSSRVMRGGSWYHLSPRTAISQSVAEGKVVQIRTVAAGDTRSAFRYSNDADYRDTSNGFRVVRELD